MKNTERERLLEVAKHYADDELELFIAETGWENWMNEYTEAEDGEPINDSECEEINKLLEDIFNEAHM